MAVGNVKGESSTEKEVNVEKGSVKVVPIARRSISVNSWDVNPGLHVPDENVYRKRVSDWAKRRTVNVQVQSGQRSHSGALRTRQGSGSDRGAHRWNPGATDRFVASKANQSPARGSSDYNQLTLVQLPRRAVVSPTGT